MGNFLPNFSDGTANAKNGLNVEIIKVACPAIPRQKLACFVQQHFVPLPKVLSLRGLIGLIIKGNC
jgi:hypothetical protein